MGIFLNPSTIVAAPYKYEFNFLAFDAFAENSYIYIPSISNASRPTATGEGKEVNFIDNYNGKLQYGFGHALVIGPSVVRNLENQAWGIHTAYRNEMSVIDVPSGLAKFIYEKYQFEPLYNQSFTGGPFAATWLSWGEIGGTYGKILIERQQDFLKVAANLNLLAGFDGMYLEGRKVDYTVYDSSTVIVHSMDAQMGHALSQDGSTGFGNFIKLRGYGVSTTIGLTYIHHRNKGAFDCNRTSDQLEKYQYRIGLSLLDFGMIHFSNDAQILTVNTSTDRLWSRIDTIKFGSVAHLDSLLSSNINGQAFSVQNKPFNMYLPTAISLQFDYCFAPRIYGNLSWVNRIYYSPKEVARGNQIAASIRYETRRFEANANVTLFEYREPDLGIGIRYGIFVIGTDRLLPLTTLTNVKSFDLYMGFKMNLCDLVKKSKGNCPAYK